MVSSHMKRIPKIDLITHLSNNTRNFGVCELWYDFAVKRAAETRGYKQNVGRERHAMFRPLVHAVPWSLVPGDERS
jgi:hypothetical protein